MVGGINANNTLNWFALLATQKNQAANSSQKTNGSSGDEDSAEISLMISGQEGQQPDPLEQLVNDGTITNDQASAIGQALQSAMQSGQTPGSGADPLASLVTSGTITQDQADSVKSTLQAAAPGQGQDSFMSNVLNNLVSSGTITQDQADSVQQALAQGHPHGGPHGAGGPPPAQSSQSSSSSSDSTDLSGMTEEQILQMLASGQITAKQAEAALEKLESEEKSTDKSATSVSSTGSSSSQRSNPLDSLVTNGTITQDQKDAIQSAFKQAFDTNYAISAYSQNVAAV
jgi:polyhydroxyalkanoate synthesis regulator phasin